MNNLSLMPMLPVRDVVVFPYMILPLFVGRESSIKAVEDAVAGNRMIFLAAQKEITDEFPAPDRIYEIGTVATIVRMKKLADGLLDIQMKLIFISVEEILWKKEFTANYTFFMLTSLKVGKMMRKIIKVQKEQQKSFQSFLKRKLSPLNQYKQFLVLNSFLLPKTLGVFAPD